MVRLLKILPEAMKALKAGEELGDKKKWKDVQTTANILGVVLASGAIVLRTYFPEFSLDDDQLIALSAVGANILFLVNGYLTTATTKTKGIKE